jgi:hypothetical protein
MIPQTFVFEETDMAKAKKTDPPGQEYYATPEEMARARLIAAAAMEAIDTLKRAKGSKDVKRRREVAP